MIFKYINILKPNAEQLALCEHDLSSDSYLIAYDTVNEGNYLKYYSDVVIERIQFCNNGKTYSYIFESSLQALNNYFSTEFLNEGWYLLDFEKLTAKRFSSVLQISEEEILNYGIYSPVYFSLLMQNYVPLNNGNAVKLLTENKFCNNDITVLPLLQQKTFTQNGNYYADNGYCGLKRVIVEVPERIPILQEKTASQNGEVLPDEGYDGLSKVSVKVLTGTAIDLSMVPEVDSIDNATEESSIMVKYDGQYYLLIKES